MGNLLAACQGSSGGAERPDNLPLDPAQWSEEDKLAAAEALFEHFDADNSGSIDCAELANLFRECDIGLAEFGLPGHFDVDETVRQIYSKYYYSADQALSFTQFYPIFKEMIHVMAAEGYADKKKLTGIHNCIEDHLGEVHMLIVSIDYKWSEELALTASIDGKNMERLAYNSGCKDIVTMYDNGSSFGSRMFPHADNVRREIQKMGKRCRKNDVFIFFYSGHGLNVPDLDGDESDGEDEAFGCPDKDGDLTADDVLVDDDFARYLDKYIPKETKILCITDCCHSGSICDVKSFAFKHKIIALASAQDNETSLDMSSFGRQGGILTTAIGDVLGELRTVGEQQFSVHEIYNRCLQKTSEIAQQAKFDQTMNIQYANCTPASFPWPLKSAFY